MNATPRYATPRYDAIARSLHWIIALGIIAEIVLGLGHDSLEDSLPFAIMPVHKAIGLTILLLSLARLGWRLGHTPPPLPAAMPGWQKGSAHGLHWLFYAMMIGVPLSGWIMSSAGSYPLQWFGLFDIPKLPVAKGSLLADMAHEGHELVGKLFIPLLLLHIVAAVYHQYVVRDGVLRRML